ncbi:MAG: YidC/Oxa1 family membrane protein insertase [Bacilli bacterium]|nr:YidC/Oxa1 family membrane protein insertase [Bacilli bacterium]
MKKRNIKLILILTMVLSLTGCTKILKNADGDVVKNTITGQNLTANILCKPTNEETIALYENNGVDLSVYPECSDFSINSNNYEGIWATVFVKPLAWLIIKVGTILNSYGFSIILITLLLRMIMYPITKKTAMQSEVMKKAKPELDKLEKKYKNKQDKDSMMQKSQEMMLIYKQYKINPMAGCLFALIQIPLFFAFYEALNRIPALFDSNFFGLQLGTSTLIAFSKGDFYYIILNLILIPITYLSFKLNKTSALSKEQESQMYMMTNISVIMISVISFTTPIGLCLYWIFNSTFTVIQNLIVKKVKKND